MKSEVKKNKLLFSLATLLPGVGVILSPDFEFLMTLFIPLLISFTYLIVPLSIIENDIDRLNSILEEIIYPLRYLIVVSLLGTLWVFYKAPLTIPQIVFVLIYFPIGIFLNSFLAFPFTNKYGNRAITKYDKNFINSKGVPILLLGDRLAVSDNSSCWECIHRTRDC